MMQNTAGIRTQRVTTKAVIPRADFCLRDLLFFLASA
jgi:hypothetical protein